MFDKELDRQFEEIAEYMNEEDMGFAMSFGTDLCLDGHYTKEELLKMAMKIQEVFWVVNEKFKEEE